MSEIWPLMLFTAALKSVVAIGSIADKLRRRACTGSAAFDPRLHQALILPDFKKDSLRSANLWQKLTGYRRTLRLRKIPKIGEAYSKLAAPPSTAAGGRYLVRNKPAKIYEAGINERAVPIESKSLEKAIAAIRLPAYQEALEVLGI